MKNLLSYNNRIKNNDDFKKIYKFGRSVAERSFRIKFKRNNMDHSRLGLSITKKVGNAVARNKIKRLIREVFRKRWKEINPGYDIIIIVSTKVTGISYREVEEKIEKLCWRAHLWEKRASGENHNKPYIPL